MAGNERVTMPADEFDVVVVGAGVVGCALAREFSRLEARILLLEAKADLGDEASKGNTAWLCSGWDAPPDSLERRCVVRGHARYRAEAPRLGLPIHAGGHLVIARTEPEARALEAEGARARAEGFATVAFVDSRAAYERVPALAPGIVAALWAPDDAIIDPFSTPYAYALDAIANGVRFRARCPVTAARRRAGSWRLSVPDGEIAARLVINCAGLRGDVVDRLAGFDDFTIRPRRGQYILFDKSARGLCDAIVTPAPVPGSRGIGIQPTIFGNLLVGPTAEEVDDPADRRTTRDGIEALLAGARHLLPALLDHPATTCYAGMRPATEAPDYRIIARLEAGWITVGGIRSTGLSGALGIAEHVVGLAVPDALDAPRKSTIRPVRVPSLSETDPRPWMDASRVAADPAYGEIVCHCERISLGELRDVFDSPLPPNSLGALKRRSRAMMGRCQGFFCGARIERMFEQARAGRSP